MATFLDNNDQWSIIINENDSQISFKDVKICDAEQVAEEPTLSDTKRVSRNA